MTLSATPRRAHSTPRTRARAGAADAPCAATSRAARARRRRGSGSRLETTPHVGECEEQRADPGEEALLERDRSAEPPIELARPRVFEAREERLDEGRRMADTAAHLVDRVLPEVPVRQWLLSLPFALR
jgi:hypothetical protein